MESPRRHKGDSDIDEREIMKREWKTGMKQPVGSARDPPRGSKSRPQGKVAADETSSDEDEDERKIMFKEWTTGFKWLPGAKKKKQEAAKEEIRPSKGAKPSKRAVSGTVLEKGPPNIYDHMLGKGGGSVSEYTDESTFKRRRRKRICMTNCGSYFDRLLTNF